MRMNTCSRPFLQLRPPAPPRNVRPGGTTQTAVNRRDRLGGFVHTHDHAASSRVPFVCLSTFIDAAPIGQTSNGPIATCQRAEVRPLDALVLRHRVLPDHLTLSVACHAASSVSFACLFAAPFVSGALEVRRFARLAGNLALLVRSIAANRDTYGDMSSHTGEFQQPQSRHRLTTYPRAHGCN